VRGVATHRVDCVLRSLPQRATRRATLCSVEPDLLQSWRLRSALRAAAEDEGARMARRNVCHALVSCFVTTGALLRVTGHLVGPQRVDQSSPFGNGEDGLVALGYLSETAACLITGATELLERGNCYAGAALNRQLVEVEYLAWAFAEDRDEAATWLRSDRADRLQRWQPRHIRDRSQGRFRSTDYADHCDLGGHPTPQGARTLVADSPPRNIELMFSETATHGVSAWDYVQTAVGAFCAEQGLEADTLIPRHEAEAVSATESDWRSQDRLAAIWHAARSQSTPVAPSTVPQ
jgi:hypothetical protein